MWVSGLNVLQEALYLLHSDRIRSRASLHQPLYLHIDWINSLSGSDYFFAFFFSLHSLRSQDWIGIIVFPVLIISPKIYTPRPTIRAASYRVQSSLGSYRGSGDPLLGQKSFILCLIWFIRGFWWIISSCNKLAKSGLTSDKAFQARCGDCPVSKIRN